MVRLMRPPNYAVPPRWVGKTLGAPASFGNRIGNIHGVLTYCFAVHRGRFLLKRITVFLLIFIGLAAVPAAAIAMRMSGIGWDAYLDTQQAIAVRELPAGISLEEAYEAIYYTSEFYGVLIHQLGDLLHGIFTGSFNVQQPDDLRAYRWQGLANLLLATTAAASLGAAVGSALKSTLAGSFTWALTMTTPVLFGMSTMNIKDMPVASGLTLVASALIFSRSLRSTWQRWAWPALLLSAGAWVAIATRPSMWTAVLALVLVSLVLFGIVDMRSKNPSRSLPGVCAFALAVPSTLFFLWLTNPFGKISLFSWLWDAYSVMSDYPWDGFIRTAGQDVWSQELPWWYVPAWLFAQLPVLTSVAIVAGVIMTVWILLTRREPWGAGLFAMAPIYVQALIIPLAIVVSGAVLYDAIRHLVFMIPALIAIAAIPIAYLDRIGSNGPHRLLISACAIALLTVGLSAWATARWVPYSYAFINPIAGIDKSDRHWELDLWGLSAYEGVNRLQQLGLGRVAVAPSKSPALPLGVGSEAEVEQQANGRSYGLYVFKRFEADVGECVSLFAIKRDGQVLGEGALCNPAPSIG